MTFLPLAPLLRLWGRITFSPDCWLWTGAKTKNGYGATTIGGRWVYLHRLAWELNHGPVPDGMSVLHRCDVRNCVRPDHLFLGTQADNMADRDAKGRNAGLAIAHTKRAELHLKNSKSTLKG